MKTALLLPLAAALLAPAIALAQEAPASWRHEWPDTDFSKRSIELSEVIAGGPPRDGIPAVDDPAFAPVADTSLPDREPVMSVAIPEERARAYPVRYLMWHEIVNDRIADVPVTVTFCPLCNSGLVFDGRLKGRTLTFGVSGKLRHSDMIMYDRQTESWWQQFTGEAIVGELTGAKLTAIPSRLASWQSFRQRHPDGLVMKEPKGTGRAYGRNPYAGYDSTSAPFLYRGEMPPHGIPALARVVRVGDRAWPLERLREAGEITEAGVRLIWREGQASALDTRDIASGREVGDVEVLSAETGEPKVHEVVFAFAFHAFEPDGVWMTGD